MPADPPSLLLIVALFVAAAAGWLFGRYWPPYRPGSRAAGEPDQNKLSEEYFRGLRFLLDEEPDKALEVFLRMVDVDNDTVETHFTLGNLYRRRGEVERAIRVHENIMARPSLSDEHRLHAMFALGEDFFRAGLFDRAERLFLQLADGGGRHVPALRYLLRIYEQQRDWEQAIAAHRRLVAVASPEHPTAIAHYHCELAEQLRAAGDFDGAREQLHLAREAQRNFPRGALIRADIALDMNQPELAALLCQRAVELHPKLLTLALPRVMRAMRGTDAGEIERRFRAWMRPDPVARAELAYSAVVAGLEQEAFVSECLPDLLREDPTLGEIINATSGDPSQLTAEQRTALATALGRILRRTQRYRCVDCGFASASHFWQCPGCRSWDAFAPVALLDLTPGMHRR
ncbi:lipopolysaccharide assembly protein LapB [Steroidobacter sp.]|uniref:lipopolysaccharide assembly protein LapB n=1 Tax=Steroidobacter sp. TaxID=1978227 RepID=UPI001A559AAD|nr:lipopolysaccharide assembly protein LapB [Steroidobacter sp.]MBL8267579.1 lipopolysaccharide assembly protein LapB [Steroidobacter sp.]